VNDRDKSSGRPLVIGVGHRDRGDDGVGPAVVDALSHRTTQVTTIIREGDLAVLPLLWESDDDVVIVDASFAASGEVGHIHEIGPSR
jgi:hydrogenase maturation protease